MNWTNSSIEALTSQIEDGDWVSRFELYPSRELFTQIDYFTVPTTIAFVEEKRLNIATGYHVSQIRMSTRANVYEVNKDFPFINHFNQIIYWTSESGLYEFWKRNRYSIRENLLVQRNKNSNITRNRVQIDNDSSVVSTFIVWGWTASTIVFVAEIVWSRVWNKLRFARNKMRVMSWIFSTKAAICLWSLIWTTIFGDVELEIRTEDENGDEIIINCDLERDDELPAGKCEQVNDGKQLNNPSCYIAREIEGTFDIDISKFRLLTSFLSRGLKPVKASVFTEYDMASLLELHHYTGHALRRTSATVFVNEGANMDSLKRLVGV
ncbi:hypothetical protein Bhyg_05439 [Pseudolycoriella hygida]|uniref:Uncharacterized protein n=1 Tax=Pseudolycoriella hygida TaxID=35572 RepID=A0A9Q0NI06_9DIPT|nr:hypothetical protein Bhyg_05439 [Pseudolycoriella hygida]